MEDIISNTPVEETEAAPAPKKTARRARVKKAEPVTEAEPEETKEKITSDTDSEKEKEVFAESKERAKKKNISAITAYAKSHDNVLTVDGEERASNAVDEYSKALIDLSMSKSNKIVLRDKIDSIEKRDGNYAAVLYHGPFKVYIPAIKLISRVKEAIPGKTLAETYGYVMQASLGAEIEYICELFTTGPENSENIAMGNHLAACEIYQKRYYIDIDRRTNSPRIYPGRIVEAKIMAVRRYGVFLNVFGFEKFVGVNNLTYGRLDYAYSEFAVDDIIEVKITGIEYEKDEKGRNVKVKDIDISVKELQSNPLKKALENCTPGAFYTGEVSMIDEKGVFVSCSFGDVKATCFCHYPPVSVNTGSKVTVRVTGVDAENLRFWGTIIRVNKL